MHKLVELHCLSHSSGVVLLLTQFIQLKYSAHVLHIGMVYVAECLFSIEVQPLSMEVPVNIALTCKQAPSMRLAVCSTVS